MGAGRINCRGESVVNGPEPPLLGAVMSISSQRSSPRNKPAPKFKSTVNSPSVTGTAT
jgi:hypothetical protein